MSHKPQIKYLAIHGNKARFEMRYGRQEDLLAECNAMIGAYANAARKPVAWRVDGVGFYPICMHRDRTPCSHCVCRNICSDTGYSQGY